MSPVCICSTPAISRPDDPRINPSCPAHSPFSLGNVWRTGRDRELAAALVVVGLAVATWWAARVQG